VEHDIFKNIFFKIDYRKSKFLNSALDFKVDLAMVYYNEHPTLVGEKVDISVCQWNKFYKNSGIVNGHIFWLR